MAGKGLNRQTPVPAHERIFVVGLAGPSGSGKSTVARNVASRLSGHVISMETYALEMNERCWITTRLMQRT
jgi:uridine kinase